MSSVFFFSKIWRIIAATLGLLMAGMALVAAAKADEVALYDGHQSADVMYDDPDAKGTLALAAGMLAGDLHDLSGQALHSPVRAAACPETCVVIGLYDGQRIKALAQMAHVRLDDLTGQWEVYRRFVVRDKGATYLVIAGADLRGAVYGAVDLSRTLGVSPWAWWADVTPEHHDRLSVSDVTMTSMTPSVQYRGIFLNDEDWGLEPWAAKTFDPAKGNIGPKTYERVFQLMWRLKANTLWPAMHSVSAPFYSDPENPKLAKAYAIVIGTSHAEPMMRNNLREWDEAKRGPFDFTRNRKQILSYWDERVQQVGGNENIYTVGLRGIHDGPMQGATTTEDRLRILEDVIGAQRQLLSKDLKKPLNDIPQVYVAYHELQEAYDAGLKVPDDVTLMWADDNYGYLRRLSTPAEQKRAGGSGVYYHLSYWGRPHDYLWLGTTHPGLIHEEMQKAYALNDRRMWIVNVGDIKPIEYLSQYFLDLAFDAKTFDLTPRQHLTTFMREQFGPEHAEALSDLMMRYYDLAFERRPEFMGFGQTEWVTPNRHTDYVASDGEEAQARIAAYQKLAETAQAIGATLPADRQAAYFELVLYPVRAAADLNTRILSLDLADLYAREQRASANLYVAQARAAHAELVTDTAHYNDLLNGKWRDMMDMAPRRLPVFDEPEWPSWSPSTKTGCGLDLWGQWINDHNTLTFVEGRPQTRNLTVFTHQPTDQTWRVQASPGDLTLSATSGELKADNRYEARLSLTYDGKAPAGDLSVPILCGDQVHSLYVRILPALPMTMTAEDNRSVTLRADQASLSTDWQKLDGLGSLGSVLRARLDLASAQDASAAAQRPPVIYHFATATAVGGKLSVIALPTHALTPEHGVRAMVSLDGAPPQVLDFATLGRSDVWRGNVLTNTAVQTVTLSSLPAGEHTLKLYALDPGVIIDRIELDLDGAKAHYGALRTDPGGPLSN